MLPVSCRSRRWETKIKVGKLTKPRRRSITKRMATVDAPSDRRNTCRGLGGAHSEHCRERVDHMWGESRAGKEKHAPRLLRDPVPTPGPPKLDKPSEATPVVPAFRDSAVGQASGETQGACRTFGRPGAGRGQ